MLKIFVALFGIAVLAFLVCNMLWPHWIWQVFHAWKYKYPELNEPSDAAHTQVRVISGVVTIIVSIMLIQTLAKPDPNSPAEQEKREQQARELQEHMQQLINQRQQ